MTDTGYVFAIAPCFACKLPFAFDPELVPSIPIDPVTDLPPDMGGDPERAERQPVCRHCIERANIKRRAAGDDEIPILPGAYIDEEGD